MIDLFAESRVLILKELHGSLSGIHGEEVQRLVQAILSAKKIFVVGAGRMGILLSTFSMRLNHLGFASFVVGSTNCPPIHDHDLMLVVSSSGETPTVREVVRRAVEQKATIAAITASAHSTIASMASFLICIHAPSALAQPQGDGIPSQQPMKTLFEQTLFITLEAMVLCIMKQTGQTSLDMARRHTNLE
jgi:6-phospho-3-hexuloisomerase